MTKTTTEIETLSAEAAQAGDAAQVALCERALDGDADAIAECARVLDDARAMRDPECGHTLCQVDTAHYGWVTSHHVSWNAADAARDAHCVGLRDAIPVCMYVIVPGIVGTIGERIRY